MNDGAWGWLTVHEGSVAVNKTASFVQSLVLKEKRQ